jgi:DNA-binding response OmpR family regulator
VDDSPSTRRLLAEVLGAKGWTIEAVESAERAAAVALARPPDLILSDLWMPGLSGLQLCQLMRGDPATASIPVVLLSARAGEESAIEGLDAGADDYLTKPFSARELLARVRSNLELARLRNREAEFRAAARHHAVSQFDADLIVPQYEAYYAEILKK